MEGQCTPSENRDHHLKWESNFILWHTFQKHIKLITQGRKENAREEFKGSDAPAEDVK